MSNPKAATKAQQEAFNARMRDIAIDTAVRLFVASMADIVEYDGTAGRPREVHRIAAQSISDADTFVDAIVAAMVVRTDASDEAKS